MVLLLFLSSRASRSNDDALLRSREVGDPQLLRVRDIVVIATLIAAAAVTYLIFFATDSLGHRRLYLLICATTAGAVMLASHMLDHLAKRDVAKAAS